MLNQRCLDFGRRQTVTADVDNIVYAAPNPVEALVVSASTIASELRLLAIPSKCLR